MGVARASSCSHPRVRRPGRRSDRPLRPAQSSRRAPRPHLVSLGNPATARCIVALGRRTSRIVSAPRSSYALREHGAGHACPQRHLGQAGSSQNRLSTREQPYGHGATRIVSDGGLAGSARRCRPGSKRSKSRSRLLKRLSLADAHPAPRRFLRQQSLALAALLAALRVEIASIHECSASVQLTDPPTQNEGPFGPSSTPQRRSQQIDQRLSPVAPPPNVASRRGCAGRSATHGRPVGRGPQSFLDELLDLSPLFGGGGSVPFGKSFGLVLFFGM